MTDNKQESLEDRLARYERIRFIMYGYRSINFRAHIEVLLNESTIAHQRIAAAAELHREDNGECVHCEDGYSLAGIWPCMTAVALGLHPGPSPNAMPVGTYRPPITRPAPADCPNFSKHAFEMIACTTCGWAASEGQIVKQAEELGETK